MEKQTRFLDFWWENPKEGAIFKEVGPGQPSMDETMVQM